MLHWQRQAVAEGVCCWRMRTNASVEKMERVAVLDVWRFIIIRVGLALVVW